MASAKHRQGGLKEKIQNAQNSSADDLLQITQQFSPLISKYARKLADEDAYFDLQLKLLEIVLNIDLSKMRDTKDFVLISYIVRSLHNHYIYLIKAERLKNMTYAISSLKNDIEKDESRIMDELFPPTYDEYFAEEIDFLRKNLTAYETEIIIAACYMNISTREIAAHFGVSSPAISKVKTNALKKLRKVIEKLENQ